MKLEGPCQDCIDVFVIAVSCIVCRRKCVWQERLHLKLTQPDWVNKPAMMQCLAGRRQCSRHRVVEVREVGIQIPRRDRAHKTPRMADTGSGRVKEISSRSVAGQVGAEDFSYGSFSRQSQVGRLR